MANKEPVEQRLRNSLSSLDAPAYNSLASQTLYLIRRRRKGSGVRAYVSCHSPGIVGKRTSCVLFMEAVVYLISARSYTFATQPPLETTLHICNVCASVKFAVIAELMTFH